MVMSDESFISLKVKTFPWQNIVSTFLIFVIFKQDIHQHPSTSTHILYANSPSHILGSRPRHKLIIPYHSTQTEIYTYNVKDRIALLYVDLPSFPPPSPPQTRPSCISFASFSSSPHIRILSPFRGAFASECRRIARECT